MQEPLGRRPLALVLSGGAALGAWQGGVLYNLEKEFGFECHSVVGTSAGSLNGAAYFQRDTEMLRRVWRDVPGPSFMRWRPRLAPPSLYSHGALRAFLGTLIDEERCRRERRCWFYAVSADIGGHGLLQAEYAPDADGPWDGPVLDHVLGSIAVPFIFPPVRVEGENGGRMLVDGHLTSFIDLDRLVERGARDFVFVNVVNAEGLRGVAGHWRAFVSRLINHMLTGQVRNSLAPLRSRAKPLGLRAFEFTPRRPLDMSVFGFKREECRAAFDQGVRESREFIARCEDFRIL